MLEIITPTQAAELLQDGDTVMYGGFLGVGSPHRIFDALLDKGVKDLTVIGNDTSYPEFGIGRLVVAGRVKKVITSHIGTNPVSGQLMNSGQMEVELVPQGTLAERIRCAGAGLGGVLTPTGIGTMVEEGKEKITIDGRAYLLEKALFARVAVLHAKMADRNGNLVFSHSARNFNPVMAPAAEVVIVEVENLVDVGVIPPDQVHTPGIFVDYIVKS